MHEQLKPNKDFQEAVARILKVTNHRTRKSALKLLGSAQRDWQKRIDKEMARKYSDQAVLDNYHFHSSAVREAALTIEKEMRE